MTDGERRVWTHEYPAGCELAAVLSILSVIDKVLSQERWSTPVEVGRFFLSGAKVTLEAYVDRLDLKTSTRVYECAAEVLANVKNFDLDNRAEGDE